MNGKALLYEFFGTFLFVIIGMLCISVAKEPGGGLVTVALAHGLGLACLVAASAPVSGGHLNPGVTIAMLFRKKIDFMNALGYIIAQCVGSIAGAYAIVAAMDKSHFETVGGFGVPKVAEHINPMGGLVLEAIFTFFLVYVVFMAAARAGSAKMGPFYVGLAVVTAAMCIGPYTGACLNAARWLGPAMVANDWSGAQAFLVAPLIGALLAAIVTKPGDAPSEPPPAASEAAV